MCIQEAVVTVGIGIYCIHRVIVMRDHVTPKSAV